ncbi:MAG TPA: L-histidine N(alpha)-methyltransferase [Thermoanaerobaculia bacterium]|nr:L-histidine N(alpha)-methyltransferase [Thermoanaerobaculia bacterium]
MEPTVRSRIHIDRPLAEDAPEGRIEELVAALTATPRRIPSQYFYDDRGSALFERICELPEYYQTRSEAALLAAVADEIARRTGARTLVELGSGAATKTRLLLDALERAGRLERYVPVDVSASTLQRVAVELVELYPTLEVHGVVGDFLHHLDIVPSDDGERLVIFLGGTIGNLEPSEARAFLSEVGERMVPGESLLIGVDLIKDESRLVAAYNDAAGVTAAFNLNALEVVNRLLDGDFDPSRFRHAAPWNAAEHRIEMWLIAEEAMTVRLREVDLTLELAEGEGILTEVSTKYDEALARRLLADSGFTLERWFVGEEGLFGLALAVRP